MTLLHIDIHRGCGLTHDECDAPGLVVNVELLGLVLAWWIGVRR